MNLDDTMRLCMLLDAYGELLSSRQKALLSDYVNLNMSLSEISENEGVSRQAVLDAIKSAEGKLENYEKTVGHVRLKQKLKELLTKQSNNLKDEITKILEEY